jgi:hypothetical protein
VEQVLAEYGIERQVYHGGSLQGKHCQRLLENHEAILLSTAAIMKDPVIRRYYERANDIDDKIDEHVNQMLELMESLHALCSLTARQKILATDAECDTVDHICTYFGDIWRAFMAGKRTPKFHALETHLPIFFRQWRNTGDYAEDPIERYHHIMKCWQRVYANIASWPRRQQLIHNRMAQQQTPDVQIAVQTVTTSKKRTLTAVAAAANTAAATASAVKKMAKLVSVGEKAKKFNRTEETQPEETPTARAPEEEGQQATATQLDFDN